MHERDAEKVKDDHFVGVLEAMGAAVKADVDVEAGC
jgi:hypothetical protein